MPEAGSTAPDEPRELRPFLPGKRRKTALVWGAGLFVLLYYNLDLLPMALHTLIPFSALATIGLFLALVVPRGARTACSWVFALVTAAVLLRRAATLREPLSQVIFGGTLAMGGYPPWAAWLAELLRLGSYWLALRVGARLGRRLRPPAGEAAA